MCHCRVSKSLAVLLPSANEINNTKATNIAHNARHVINDGTVRKIPNCNELLIKHGVNTVMHVPLAIISVSTKFDSRFPRQSKYISGQSPHLWYWGHVGSGCNMDCPTFVALNALAEFQMLWSVDPIIPTNRSDSGSIVLIILKAAEFFCKKYTRFTEPEAETTDTRIDCLNGSISVDVFRQNATEN